MDRRISGWMDERIDGRMGYWMVGWIDKQNDG